MALYMSCAVAMIHVLMSRSSPSFQSESERWASAGTRMTVMRPCRRKYYSHGVVRV